MTITAYVSIDRFNDRIDPKRLTYITGMVSLTLAQARDSDGQPAVRFGPCTVPDTSPAQAAVWLLDGLTDDEAGAVRDDLARAARDYPEVYVTWCETTPVLIKPAPPEPPTTAGQTTTPAPAPAP